MMYAIHRVNYDGTLSAQEAQGVARAIEQHGYILPHGELVRQGLSGNMCFGLDYLAGDCEYVFLKPIADDWQGWLKQFKITDAFVFDMDVLMEHDALYGTHDLLENYKQIAHEALLGRVGVRLSAHEVPIFFDLLLMEVGDVPMSSGAKRIYSSLSYNSKMRIEEVAADVFKQELAGKILDRIREKCLTAQNLARHTTSTDRSRDSCVLNRLLQVAQNEGWKSQHALASELEKQQFLGREVLFPGPLPVSLAISCP